MPVRRGALVAVLLIAPAAHALAPTGPTAAEWTITADAAVDAAPRAVPRYDWNTPARPAAWQRFAAIAPGRWWASWDHGTAVPNRIYGEGLTAPGSVADGAIAERFARAFLADHLDLLAPGAAATDFVLAANVSDGEIRSIGFYQYKDGMRVVGGQVGFEFKRDRLFVIHSEALPDVKVAPYVMAAPQTLAAAARARTLADTGVADARAGAPGAPVILPLVGDDRVLGYRVVAPVEVDAGSRGRWTVYADPSSGATIARHQELLFSTATVGYDVVVRWEGRPRQVLPAQRMHATVDGSAQTTDLAGTVAWSDVNPAEVGVGTEGDLVKVANATGPTQTHSASVAPGGNLVWSEAQTDTLDAELNAFAHVQVVKAYVRTFDPGFAYLDEQIKVTVDIADTCNAFYSGDLNFFAAGTNAAGQKCGNTGTIADVIYHEYEHGVHEHELIPGVGQFDGSLSEGQSDFIAAEITGDSGVGRGFYTTDEPLREIDPPGEEIMWPQGTGEVHAQGMIFSGAMWDLRKALIAELGESAAVPIVNKIFVNVIRRSSTIPSTVIEALAADDDDGNLGNGTPHDCDILAAFGAHGLRPWSAITTQPGSIPAATGATTAEIDVDLNGISQHCAADQLSSITLRWSARSGSMPKDGSVAMTGGADPAHWSAQVPLPPAGRALNYQVQLEFADGATMYQPDDRADAFYALYFGDTVPLYCTTFDTDPFQEGWAHMALQGNDDWAWGPAIPSETGDPGTAYTGTHIVGTNLGGTYSANTDERLILPRIDFGKYSDVHLQYHRHLAVDDGNGDQATVLANDELVWQNPASRPPPNQQEIAFVDGEWVFDDLPLSGHVATGHQVTVTFELHSNGGNQLGGWNIDDLCVVANANVFCGDGVKQGGEQCDNGAANADLPNVCRTDCRLPACGDGILDTGEACDDGNKQNGDGCSSKCVIEPAAPPGCCDASGAPGAGSIATSLVAAGLFLRRRRRRS
jgi:cysteine-rich repeat protein